ncbi:MAG TPA: HAD-IC family P-type ATPase, partial [Caldisericia bacterium]|nr:HAD-IC family P-type ATPase [Caldisericia bacterium]
MNWHSIPLDETLKTINATLQGLSSKDSKNRLEKYGPNEISAKERSSILQMVIEQFVSPLILILLAACIFSIIQGEWVDAIAIITVLVANATLGIIQQYKSEGALEALKKMSAPKAHVFRDGSIHEIPSSEVVPGDLVILSAGDLVPADLRLVETINLACNEAILTGESNPVLKDWCMTVHEQATVGDRVNMAFMGTVVTTGRGKGIAVATGKETSMGMIATSLSQVKREKTPLEIQLNHLGKVLSIVFLIVCAAVFVLGWLEMGNPGEQLLMAVSLAVAAIPEGLPAVVTIVLSIGTTRVSKQGAIIR